MKIQSISDVITNSSSEIFILSKDYADEFKNQSYINYEIMNIEWLKECPGMVNDICKLAGIEPPENMDITDEDTDWYLDCITAWIDDNKDKLNEFFENEYVMVTFSEPYLVCDTIIENAKNHSIWSDFG